MSTWRTYRAWPRWAQGGIAAGLAVIVIALIVNANAGTKSVQTVGANRETSTTRTPIGVTTVAAGPAATVALSPATAPSAPTAAASATVEADMLNPAVTQSTISSSICVTGYTTTIRPATSYTDPLKAAQIAAYGYSDTAAADYEEDHVIALEIGGSPTFQGNLFPEPLSSSNGDDALEGLLHDKVCAGTMTLAAAQGQLLATKVAHGYRRAPSLAAQVAAPVTKAPSAVTTVPPTSASTATSLVFYANCAAVKAAGKAPLYRGQPGYSSSLDRDGDGIACET